MQIAFLKILKLSSTAAVAAHFFSGIFPKYFFLLPMQTLSLTHTHTHTHTLSLSHTISLSPNNYLKLTHQTWHSWILYFVYTEDSRRYTHTHTHSFAISLSLHSETITHIVSLFTHSQHKQMLFLTQYTLFLSQSLTNRKTPRHLYIRWVSGI